MPSVNDFKNKKQKSPKVNREQDLKTKSKVSVETSARRRPGRETKLQSDSKSHEHLEKTNIATRSSPMNEEKKTSHSEETQTESEIKTEQEKVEIKFPGSEMLRSQMPKPFAVAEQVATEWKKDGSFEALPLGHPLAQMLAASGLRKAKDLEKKVVESGVIEKVAFRALSMGMKAQQEIQNIRDQVKSKFGKK